MTATVHRQLSAQAAKSLGRAELLATDGRALTEVTAEPAQRVLARRKCLTNLEKGCLRATLSGTVWTRSRLRDAGYDVSAACPMCSSGRPDTIFHRAWECPASADLRAALPPALVAWALMAGPFVALFSTGWLETP